MTIYRPEGIITNPEAFCKRLLKETKEGYQGSPVPCGTVCWGYAHLAAVRVTRASLGIGISERVPPELNEVLKKVVSAVEWSLGIYVEPSIGELRLINEFFTYGLPDWIRSQLKKICSAKQVPIASPTHRKSKKVTHKEFISSVRHYWPSGATFVDGAWHVTTKPHPFNPGMVDGTDMDAGFFLDRRLEGITAIARLHETLLASNAGLVLTNKVGSETLVPFAIPVPCDNPYGVAWMFANVPTSEWAPMLDISL